MGFTCSDYLEMYLNFYLDIFCYKCSYRLTKFVVLCVDFSDAVKCSRCDLLLISSDWVGLIRMIYIVILFTDNSDGVANVIIGINIKIFNLYF